MKAKSFRKSEKQGSVTKKKKKLNVAEYKEKVMLDFVIDCGGICFIRKIASGGAVLENSVVVDAAKKALSKFEKAPLPCGCYDPYLTVGESFRRCFPGGILAGPTGKRDVDK